jgi:UDP-2-acetamido-2,6-beta-L-arabino-hexul-4-ose reductase
MTAVLVTGAQGFIGKNLVLALRRNPETEVIATDLDTPDSEFERGLDAGDIIFHLAGVNRPQIDEDFEAGNVGSLSRLIAGLQIRKKRPLIVLTSSIQALLDNPYGRSKRRAEQILFDYASLTGTPARIFRLPGVFGKWCRPNYNSVVATLCHNIARSIPTLISDPSKEIDIVHVDDVVRAFIELAGEGAEGVDFRDVSPLFKITLGRLVETLSEFRKSRESLRLADFSDPLIRRLFSTYLSYLPSDGFSYSVEPKADTRGTLAELLKAGGHGQIFVSRTKSGVTRGNHYHDLKVEKFIVLQGDAIIRFRHMSTEEIVQYTVSGNQFRIVDIPPGWTHSIENTGPEEMIVLFWSSEVFDPARPDTYAAEVLK